MRRFLITSEKFKGEAEITYNEDGVINSLQMSHTNMAADMRLAFKNAAPALVKQIEEGGHNLKTCTIVEAAFEASFEMFWQAYGKKINRKRCLPAWNRLSKTQQVKAYFGIKKYDSYLKKETWRTKADPENYLKNEMFDNEWK